LRRYGAVWIGHPPLQRRGIIECRPSRVGVEQCLLAIKKGRAARSALIASTMHRSSRQASRAAVMKAVAADLIREQRRVISEVVRVPHGDRLYDGPGRNTSSLPF